MRILDIINVLETVAPPSLQESYDNSGLIIGDAVNPCSGIMKEMGNMHQVIAITHQPQIAARATTHFYVYKKEQLGAIKTQLKKLDETERVESIARMMSGEKPSASALQNAREMIGG